VRIAKKSTANQRKEHNAEKYIHWVTTTSLTTRVYLHSFSCCWLPELRNPAKYSAVQGHRSWCQSQAPMQLTI